MLSGTSSECHADYSTGQREDRSKNRGIPLAESKEAWGVLYIMSELCVENLQWSAYNPHRLASSNQRKRL